MCSWWPLCLPAPLVRIRSRICHIPATTAMIIEGCRRGRTFSCLLSSSGSFSSRTPLGTCHPKRLSSVKQTTLIDTTTQEESAPSFRRSRAPCPDSARADAPTKRSAMTHSQGALTTATTAETERMRVSVPRAFRPERRQTKSPLHTPRDKT